MAKFATHMGDPHGDSQTSPQHAKPQTPTYKEKHEQKRCRKTVEFALFWSILVMFCPDFCSYFCLVCGRQGSLAQFWMWITHVGGKIRHGLLEKSLIIYRRGKCHRSKQYREILPNVTLGYLFMLGRSAAPKIIYGRPVGSPENTSNIGEILS